MAIETEDHHNNQIIQDNSEVVEEEAEEDEEEDLIIKAEVVCIINMIAYMVHLLCQMRWKIKDNDQDQGIISKCKGHHL